MLTSGNPPPEVTWLWNGRMLPPSAKIRTSSTSATAHSLTLFNVTASDLGTYTCKASNGLGSVNCTSNLSFDNRYEVRKDAEDEAHFVELPQSTIMILKDQDLTIECRVRGYPRPKGKIFVFKFKF